MAWIILVIIALTVWHVTSSVLWAVIVTVVALVLVIVLIWMWEVVRTDPKRIRETTQSVYEAELEHTFVDEVAYFTIFGREFGPFPIIPVNAGGIQGPCFVRCLAFPKPYLAFRLMGYVPRN